jgi:hypothetical protein
LRKFFKKIKCSVILAQIPDVSIQYLSDLGILPKKNIYGHLAKDKVLFPGPYEDFEKIVNIEKEYAVFFDGACRGNPGAVID